MVNITIVCLAILFNFYLIVNLKSSQMPQLENGVVNGNRYNAKFSCFYEYGLINGGIALEKAARGDILISDIHVKVPMPFKIHITLPKNN